MFYKIIISSMLFCLSCFGAKDLKNIDSFKANFSQIITSTSDNIIEYKGEVFIKKSGKILWKYKTPVEKNVYINDNFAVVDEPELEQAIFTELESEINIIKLLNSSKKIDNNSYKANIEDVDYIIKTSPSDDKIQFINYKDKLENKVEIKFSNVIQNGEITDDIFKFVIPDHYDIIRK